METKTSINHLTPPDAKNLLCEGFDYVMTFGKHKGKTLLEILDESPSYIVWLAENDIIKIPDDLLTMACHDTMSPDFEDLHGDWGCRD